MTDLDANNEEDFERIVAQIDEIIGGKKEQKTKN